MLRPSVLSRRNADADRGVIRPSSRYLLLFYYSEKLTSNFTVLLGFTGQLYPKRNKVHSTEPCSRTKRVRAVRGSSIDGEKIDL